MSGSIKKVMDSHQITFKAQLILGFCIMQKLLSDEITKTDLTELPCKKKPPISTQPSSKLAGRFGVQGSLACLGLKLHGTPGDNNASGTKLPVFAGELGWFLNEQMWVTGAGLSDKNGLKCVILTGMPIS